MKRDHVPVRTCKGCGKQTPKKTLIRFVIDQGELRKDQHNGFGLYCCPEKTCREKLQVKLKKQKLIQADKRRGQE